jgi:alkanesulfonate monooxygenase
MFGGASEGAVEMGAAECDVFAIYAEPRATTAARIAEFRARAATHGRSVGFNMSRLSPRPKEQRGTRRTASSQACAENSAGPARKPKVFAFRSTMPVADNSPLRRRRTYMTSGSGWASPARPERSATPPALVGTPEQVAESILGYYRLGVSSFLMRGFDPVSDATEFGRELIPRIKAGAAEIDIQPAATSAAK